MLALPMTKEMLDVAAIIKVLQSYVNGHLNGMVKCRNFHCHVQQLGETFEDFLISLQELAKTCKFCSESCKKRTFKIK